MSLEHRDNWNLLSLSEGRPPRLRRRAFLIGLGALTLGGGWVIFGKIDRREANILERPTLPGSIARVESASVVKALQEEIGSRAVDFESALKLVPAVATLFTQSTNSPEDSNSIANQVFVVRGNFAVEEADLGKMTLEEEYQVPGVQQLMKDYPQATFHPITISKLIGYFRRGTVSGFVDANRNAFLNLTNINKNIQNLSGPWEQYGGDLMYDEIGGVVSCRPTTPVNAFVFTELHELVHRQYDVSESNILVEEDVKQAIIKRWPKVQPIIRAGFDIYAIGGFKIVLLDELVADYIAAKISTVNGLWYDPSTTSFPIDLYNFEKLLQEAQISDGELVSLHREGKLRDFLIKIGSAANKNVRSDNNPLDTGLEIATRLSVPLAPLPIYGWREVSKYFPKIDTSRYNYFPPRYLIAPGAIRGCMV